MDELREHRALAGAAFLKAGPAATVSRLTEREAKALREIVARRNPEAARALAAWERDEMRAISIRQPYVEAILRGTKKFEYRDTATHVRGRVYLYAAMNPGDDEDWRKIGLRPGDLPTGMIVGTVAIVGCRYFAARKKFGYELERPRRLEPPVPPRRHPQPRWFYPF